MACIFCDIAAGRGRANIVYQDENITAFRDIRPRAPTHILIIPNQHIESVDTLGDDNSALAAARCLEAAPKIAAQEGLTGGYRLVTNVGPDSGQSVFHLHFHLLGGRKMGWPPG